MVITAAFGVLFSFGPYYGGLTLPFKLLYDYLVIFQAIRAPGRVMVIIMLALAVLAGIGTLLILNRYKGKLHYWVFATIILFLMADSLAIPLKLTQPVLPSAETVSWVDNTLTKDAVLLYYPPDKWQTALHMDRTLNRPLLNGYSGFTPEPHQSLFAEMLVEGFIEEPLPALSKAVGIGATHLVVLGNYTFDTISEGYLGKFEDVSIYELRNLLDYIE
jgi:hypothetical protein